MFRKKDVQAYTVFFTVLSDFLAIQVAFYISWYIRFKSGLLTVGDTPKFNSYYAVVVLWSVITLIVYQMIGLYNIRRPLPFMVEVARVFQGSLISMAALFTFNFYLRSPIEVSRLTVFLMGCLSLIWLLAFRNMLRHFWGRFLRKHDLLARVVLIGWGDKSSDLVQHVRADINSGRKIIGVLTEEEPTDLPFGIRWLGQPQDLRDVLYQNDLDEVILGTLQVSHAQISDWILICERELVQFRLIPDLFEILASRVHLDFISGVPLLGIGDFPLDRPLNRIVKRSFDILGAIAGLILSAPTLLVGAILIRLESPGPVFYVQERCGRDGKTFRMYKLRTMRRDAEKESGPVWTKENDPRRTRIGSFLRRYNIDETPQFWNVLKSEMSLVGPRPERPYFVEQFKDEIRHYMPRHSSKPGMTGWAQVNGLRGNTPLDERVRYDIFYFENWSLWFDVRIMIATIFNFKNAY
jgi:exopolysaccharide biosynthesis polyprenyl glycosylphosphotransferase